jgi:hypothetical protein
MSELPAGSLGLDRTRRAQQVERVHRPDQARQHPGGAVLGDQSAARNLKRNLLAHSS